MTVRRDDEQSAAASDAVDPSAAASHGQGSTTSAAPEHWWEVEGFPWQRKPTREELACFVAFAAIGVYSFAMMPLKPILLASDPMWLAMTHGSRTALVAMGGLLGSEGYPLWWLGLLVATISIVKFDPIYWWAGKLWGRDFLNAVNRNASEKALVRHEKAMEFTKKNLFWAVLITHLPIPFPDLVVGIAAGASGVSFKKYILLDFVLALPMRVLYLWVGFVYADQAVAVLAVVERYSLWLSLAIVVFMLGSWYWNSRKRQSANAATVAG